jgi:hypothetical protein
MSQVLFGRDTEGADIGQNAAVLAVQLGQDGDGLNRDALLQQADGKRVAEAMTVPSSTSTFLKTVLKGVSQTFTADVRRHWPFQKKYRGSSLGDACSASTTRCGSGTRTGVPVF